MNAPFKKLDLKHTIFSLPLYSRMIWQVLFDEYRSGNGNLSRMGDMLCDLHGIEEQLKRWSGDESDLEVEFYWTFSDFLTSLRQFAYPFESSIRVVFNAKEQYIDFFRHEEPGP